MIDEQNRLHGIISMPTGSGKTRLATALIIYLINRDYVKDKAILFLSPRRVINEQNKTELENALRKFNLDNFSVINLSIEGERFTGEESAKDSLYNILSYISSNKIIILTPQLLHSYLQYTQDNNEISRVVGAVILDEVHHTYWGEEISKSIKSLLDNIKFVFGLTATPIKEAVENIGNILYSYTSSRAGKDGILVNEVKIYSYDTIISDINQEEAWKVAIKERAEVYANELVKILKTKNDKRILKTLVVATNTKEADLLYEQLRSRLGRSVYIAHINISEPLKIIQDFKNKSEGILVTVNMADIGFNDRELEAIAIARRINTPIGYVQIKGRVLRKPTNNDNIKNSNYAILIDFTGSSEYESYIERVENGEVAKEYGRRDIIRDLYGYEYEGVRSAHVRLIKKEFMNKEELYENQNFIRFIIEGFKKKHSNYAYVLDILPYSRLQTKEGLIIQAIGEDNLTFLELLSGIDKDFEVGESLYIGKDKDKDIRVLGRLGYHALTIKAKEDSLPEIIYKIVKNNREGIIKKINELAKHKNPADYLNWYLKCLPKFKIERIVKAYENGPFKNYKDFKFRTGINLVQELTKSILKEMRMDNPTEFSKNKVIINNKNYKSYQCSICSKRFRYEEALKQHTRDRHNIFCN